MSWILIFLSAFIAMEWVAWALHKYVMHGFLWNLHQDHHTPAPGQVFQKNDAFALFFAVPSFFSILFDSIYAIPWLGALGYGVMAYGFAYFTVHEVIIHRRLTWFKAPKTPYFSAIVMAHRRHHQCRGKEGASDFGMLWVPLKEFKRFAITKREP